MKCINFDERFADYTSQWMKAHGKEYKNYQDKPYDIYITEKMSFEIGSRYILNIL